MSAWKRFGMWAVVLGGSMLGANAQAGPVGTTVNWDWWSVTNGGLTPGVAATQPNAGTFTAAPVLAAPTTATTVSSTPSVSISSAPVSAPDQTTTTTPTSTPVLATSTNTTAEANAFINLGTGPYPSTGSIASGNPQPWYDSTSVATLFGGTPNASQIASFDAAVLQRVQQTFSLSGINVNLTDNPNVPAAHTLSIVSNSSSIPFPGAIGTTTLTGNGFSFIDAEAPLAQSVDQLETIVAHNVAHELMLAFGVGENYDQTGNYIDATHASWSMITNMNSTFSSAAAAAINQALQSSDANPGTTQYAQFTSEPVPEPATIALWAVAGLTGLAYRARRSSR